MAHQTEKSTEKNIVDLQSIEWDCILRDVLKCWWMIVLFALTAAMLFGGIRELRYKPKYQSSTTFVIGRSGFSYQQVYDNLTQANTTTKQFSEVVQSSLLHTQVCEELGLSSFDAEVSVNTIESTNLMVMTVTADTPRKAFLINNAIRSKALELMGLFLEGVTIMELEAANVPNQPSNPLNLPRDMGIAALIGAVLMTILLTWISFWKDTIKNAEDVIRKVDTPLLGTIYYESNRRSAIRRRGTRRRKPTLTLSNPMLSLGFLESYRMLASRVRIATEKNGKKVLMVTSVTEGEGKSTVSANLAIALAQGGNQVLLIDCDFRKPTQYKVFRVRVNEDKDFVNAIKNRTEPKMIPYKTEPNLQLLLSRRGKEESWDQSSMEYLTKLIGKMREQMDYVILDTSPMAFVSDSEEYAMLTDASLLVVRQNLMEASYINDAIDNLEDTGTELLGCVLNSMRRGVVRIARERSNYHGSAYGNDSNYRKAAAGKGEQKI